MVIIGCTPVAFGVFDYETNENWVWFMQKLREAIGSPSVAVMTGVKDVYPEAEHRECMFHLVSNFKKKHRGKVFTEHLWAAAYSWHPYFFEKHWDAMEKAKPKATQYLRDCHKKLWTRSQFRTIRKVDYVTNNLAESFNKWIKEFKAMNLDDLMDKIRQLLMVKWNQRRKVARNLEGVILPHVMKNLNERSRDLNMDVEECGDEVGEISVLGGSGYRHVVNLTNKTCSCRTWQVSGIPCKHAIAFITSLSDNSMENYVDHYYSIEKFRAAYAQLIPALPDKSQWPKSEHGFFLYPPLLKSVAGRRKTERYKGFAEGNGNKGRHQCPICKKFGHHWHNCREGNPEDIAAMLAERGPPKKKRKTTESNNVPVQEVTSQSMIFPLPSENNEIAIQAPSSEKTARSKSGSNQPEVLSIEYPIAADSKKSKCNKRVPTNKPTGKNPGAANKPKGRKKDGGVKGKNLTTLDSPAMGTRSKKMAPASPAMSTRSKR
ncbi:hypothetical protein U9M48_001529, partial [Paspalum notatum var. saurae]